MAVQLSHIANIEVQIVVLLVGVLTVECYFSFTMTSDMQ
jgi:hypothetical protein